MFIEYKIVSRDGRETTINHSYKKNYEQGPRQMGGGAGGGRAEE
jgi:hypothetical protein